MLLPDRQALWAWQQHTNDDPEPNRLGELSGSIDGVWLGFAPSARERRQLQAIGAKRMWLSGATPPGWPTSWAASGPSGYLQAAFG